ncbi:MFS transporter [Arthrobacter sp. ISL-85]|uniref:MFS transporter n=1 Tax=Arthrobacter sp. ISL-85 TaxID=2819115 RepID=UPI001BE50A82|nr:MFS transporter [Arthrobacter sp. ISL-85]MBT2565173.1 MFS transporter [Arthrobacter sp. ISL-85]
MNATATQPSRPASPRRVSAAIVTGTALEYFDFFLYSAMAALVIGPTFFPSSNSVASTMASLATFGVGYLARPFAGLIFGIIGDKFGRRTVLTWSLVLMGVSSGLIGLIPSYATIGIAAPILLVLLRIVQGVGAGAEFSSAIAAAYEFATPKRRGRLGSLPTLGVNLGVFAASLVVAGLALLGNDFFFSWGWRIPFVLSFVLAGVGYLIRLKLPETPEFLDLRPDQARRSWPRVLADLFRSDWRGVVIVFIVYTGYALVATLWKTFALSYLTEFQHVGPSVSTFGVTLASLFAIIWTPLCGRLCDAVPIRWVLAIGGVLVIAYSVPFFWLLDTRSPIWIWVALILGTGFLAPLLSVATSPFMARQFSTNIRVTGIGVGKETSGAVGGGLGPVVALALVGSAAAPSTLGVSVLFAIGGALFVIAAWGGRTVAPAVSLTESHTPARTGTES